MSDLSVQMISRAVIKANQAMTALEQVLNDADAKLGDGDTGGMLARVIKRMSDVDLDPLSTVGAALTQLAKAATLATGSSLGTLVATGLLAAGKHTKEAEKVPADQLATLVQLALDAMMARGGASLGDKTVLDSLHAVALSLRNIDTLTAAKPAAVKATFEALDDFRSRPNRIGRARMFGDQTIGIDDPGMLAVAELSRAIAD